MAIRPDGSSFLLGVKNGVQLWNRDRSPGSAVLWHHTVPHPLAWSADGKRFATAGKNGLVRVWRVNEARPLSAQLPVPKAGRLPIVFAPSPDGTRVLTATEEEDQSEFQVSALAGGKADCAAVRVRGQPSGAAFSPDGQNVYAVTVAKGRGWLHAWKWASGQAIFPPVELTFEPYDVACRPDGEAIAVAGDFGKVEVRAAGSGELLGRYKSYGPFFQPIFVANRIRFAPDGRTFVTCGMEAKIGEWDGRTSAPLRSLTIPGWNRCIDVRYAADGQFLVAASTKAHQAVVLDRSTGQPVATLQHPDFVFTARFDPTGERIVTACRDGKTRIWDWRANRLSQPPLIQNEEVTDAAFSPDGHRVASAEAGGKVRVWDARSGLPLAPAWLLQAPGEVPAFFANRVEFTHDGRYLLVGVRRRHLLVFNLTLVTEPPPASLTADDLLLLAEINAGTSLRSDGTLESLTSEQWYERWQAFRQKHPDFHALPAR